LRSFCRRASASSRPSFFAIVRTVMSCRPVSSFAR
jgi:hypothetical protein